MNPMSGIEWWTRPVKVGVVLMWLFFVVDWPGLPLSAGVGSIIITMIAMAMVAVAYVMVIKIAKEAVVWIARQARASGSWLVEFIEAGRSF